MFIKKRFFILYLALASIKIFTNTHHDKWIVVTTINYPTQTLKKLSRIEGWRLVVVADKKTPLDWQLDNCDYLSLKIQQELPYQIIKHIPWNHYSRKNIGYLYAIEHGASLIYDTDDDNCILGDTITYLPEHADINEYLTHEKCTNPYAHFGKPNIWPRGYPLQAINSAYVNEKSLQIRRIPIQQGLVNNEPDVDALFRLTNNHNKIEFDNNQCPVCIPTNTMTPFNSQNTLFHKSAFWALLLPITPRFRVCDIWRGYWTQRILWDIGANLCFLPPTAIQYRNNHNLLEDFKDEIDLYLNAGKLIDTLLLWNSPKATIEEKIMDLMEHLIKKDFFKDEEYLFTKAWLTDLYNINYIMPYPHIN